MANLMRSDTLESEKGSAKPVLKIKEKVIEKVVEKVVEDTSKIKRLTQEIKEQASKIEHQANKIEQREAQISDLQEQCDEYREQMKSLKENQNAARKQIENDAEIKALKSAEAKMAREKSTIKEMSMFEAAQEMKEKFNAEKASIEGHHKEANEALKQQIEKLKSEMRAK